MDLQVGDNVRILKSNSIYHLWVVPVVGISFTGAVQVEAEPGVIDLFSRDDVKKV